MHAADLLSKRADLTPERIALVELETGQRYTYADLNERANRLANFMRDELDVQPGDRVSILAKNSIVYIDLFYGLPKIGAIFAPFNWRLTSRELTFMLNDLEPKVLIVEPEFAPLVEEMKADVRVEHYVNLRGAKIPGVVEYEDGVKQAEGQEPKRPEMD